MGFMFEDDDWDRLTSLPLYKDEVPDDSLVTVGFSLAGPWSIPSDSTIPTAHFYVLFVILLATPPL